MPARGTPLTRPRSVISRLLLTALLAVSFAGCTRDGLPTDGPVQFPGADDYAESSGLEAKAGARNASLRTVRVVDLAQAELLFIVEVIMTGTTGWKRSDLRYTANGRTYAAVADSGFQVCAPDSC